MINSYVTKEIHMKAAQWTGDNEDEIKELAGNFANFSYICRKAYGREFTARYTVPDDSEKLRAMLSIFDPNNGCDEPVPQGSYVCLDSKGEIRVLPAYLFLDFFKEETL